MASWPGASSPAGELHLAALGGLSEVFVGESASALLKQPLQQLHPTLGLFICTCWWRKSGLQASIHLPLLQDYYRVGLRELQLGQQPVLAEPFCSDTSAAES